MLYNMIQKSIIVALMSDISRDAPHTRKLFIKVDNFSRFIVND
ncbi:hypothetical protein KR52_11480 [Synechococcus sp. KORDI-52]|nr:hypothetical protein KR52_11480 [Synechococcus sp. KORDI-52]